MPLSKICGFDLPSKFPLPNPLGDLVGIQFFQTKHMDAIFSGAGPVLSNVADCRIPLHPSTAAALLIPESAVWVSGLFRMPDV